LKFTQHTWIHTGLLYINNVLNWFERKLYWTYWVYVLLALLVTWQVIARYFFNSPSDWFLEVAILLSIYSGFLGAALITKEGRHISFELIYTKAKPKTRMYLELINNIAGIIVSGLLAYYGIKQMMFLEEIDSKSSSSLALPYSIQTLGVVIGLILCTLYFIGRITRNLSNNEVQSEDHN
jgi:C4-dicarboxylate transporter DctQ subunit